MITQAQLSKIHRMRFHDGISINEISRKTSLSRNTIRKWLRTPSRSSIKFHKTPREKLIKPYEPWLIQALDADFIGPKRDRRTALTLFGEIQKQGFSGHYSRVTAFIQNWRKHATSVVNITSPGEELLRWMKWLYLIEQSCELHSNLENPAGLNKMYAVLNPSPNSPRKKVLVVLAKLEGFSERQIARHLSISQQSVRRYFNAFQAGGEDALLKRKAKPRKAQDPDLKKLIFALLHEPPSLHGYTRTTWRMDDLRDALSRRGQSASDQVIREVLKEAGYRWISAKVVLTSTDPDYREKYQHIQDILSSLKEEERFFSIDEYGPFAIKMKAGRMLVEAGVQPTVPQWQKSKGWLILTAALELSRNQVTHFYSKAKNTDEMIRMTEVLINQYANTKKLYISWDAASWHISKELKKHIKEHNEQAEINRLPCIELAPLPASAQFLNIIESVFSGMARAIIHNSDYVSPTAAMEAIDRYFMERNQHFLDNPKRAGKKIWGMERTNSEFSESNNCKDPAYR